MIDKDISALVSALQTPALCLRHSGQIAAFNRPFLALYPAALTGRPVALVVRRPEILRAIDAAAPDNPQSVEVLGSSGLRDQRWKVTAAQFEASAERWVLVTFEDRTDFEENLQIRRDFVANVSHELRSPLTALTGFIETLRTAARDDAAARERFLSIMEREANRMTRLVEDLLSLSRVEAEERLRPTIRTEVTGLIESVLNLIGPTAEEKGVKVHRTGLDAPIHVIGDADQLRQVFTNLVENAIKYGSGGGRIEINAKRIDQDPGLRAPGVRVDIVDHGEGFDPIHIPRLTERFYRVDGHRSREMGGTGLGLAIVKHIVNRHRGRLQIDSTPGKGSTFSVLLPVHPGSDPA